MTKKKALWDFSGGSVLRLCTANAGDLGLIPAQGTIRSIRTIRLELIDSTSQLKILHATTKIDHLCHNKDQKSHVLQIRPNTTK